MRLVRVSEPRMNSCLTGTGGRTPPAITSTTKTYGFDHHHHHHQLDMELFKPTTTTTTKSVGHSSPSSSSSSPSSTISEASDNQQLSLSTKKPRTPRKRPNQTYNEAAALLSTAYPNIFATTNLAKPPFKFSKRVEPNWGYTTNGNINPSIIGEELLLPQSIPSKPIGNSSCNFFEPRLALGSDSNSNNRCTTPDSNPCQNRRIELALEEEEEVEEEFQFYQRGSEEYDFDAESILDEEIGAGILDSIMGNPPMVENSSSNESQNHHHRQTTTNFCYGIPMGLGLGLPSSSRFDFRLGMTRGIRAFRNVRDGGGGMYGDQWWKCPVTTVEVGAISPRFEEKKAEEEVQGQPVSIAVGSNNSKSNLSDKKKSSGSSSSSKKKKLKLKEVEERERSSAAAKVNERQALPSERGEGSSAAASSGRINLKLNYDEVINAWSDNGSMFSEDAAGLEFTGSDALARLAQIDLFGENGGIREASVQRYKEKRRNRLFTKKIVRYQVRKVNADQRPRVKGRFVRSPDSREDGGEEDKQT